MKSFLIYNFFYEIPNVNSLGSLFSFAEDFGGEGHLTTDLRSAGPCQREQYLNNFKSYFRLFKTIVDSLAILLVTLKRKCHAFCPILTQKQTIIGAE